jgi:hypothetical protein
MEATMNKDVMEEYLDRIITNLAKSEESLKKYENIVRVKKDSNFNYTVETAPLLSE